MPACSPCLQLMRLCNRPSPNTVTLQIDSRVYALSLSCNMAQQAPGLAKTKGTCADISTASNPRAIVSASQEPPPSGVVYSEKRVNLNSTAERGVASEVLTRRAHRHKAVL